MGKALQVLSGRVTNPGAALTALTMDTGDSNVVRSFPFGTATAEILDAWVLGATAGVLRIRSPRLHDQAQGIRLRTQAAAPGPLMPFEASQLLYPQDPLTIELSGGGAEVDLATLLLYYSDMPGIDSQLVSYPEIANRIVNLVGVERNFVTGATAGDYGGGGALNANFDNLIRNVDYALLGYLCDVNTGTVGLTGPDTGNVRVGGPGINRPDITSDWFVELSERSGYPCIPVINAANVGATTVDLADTAVGAARNVTFIFAELK